MEHWMTEPSTIYTLMMLSQPSRNVGLENEEEMKEAIEAAIRVRNNDKAFQLAQLCFFGELELSLFSSFDIRGDELLIHFQNRLAERWSPHDLPDKKDITTLLRIFRENADGRPVAWYRYLWCDALSASVFQRSKDIYTSKEDDNPLRELMRKTILEPGIMMEPAEVLRVFGIDEVSPIALLKLYNL
jgi:Zn-dependent oligopeptidase